MLFDALIFSLPFISCTSHVAWLFPEARQPHFDYTNNRDNVPPCGLAASTNVSDEHQTFVTGKTYSLSWRMHYAHQGGLQINLLSVSGKYIQRLVPDGKSKTDLFDTKMLQQQEAEVRFDQPCEHCILQLMKQAQESDTEFRYFTCADIKIVPDKDTASQPQQCRSNSKWTNGTCECDQEHAGEYCSIKVDCQKDSDCGEGGVCQEYPNSDTNKVCHCAYGRLGKNCKLVSTPIRDDDCFNSDTPDPNKLDKFDAHGMFKRSCYKQKQLNENDFVYSRVVNKDEIEVIMDFKGLSYIAIGWRPINLTTNCRDYPAVGMELAGFTQKAYSFTLHPMHCTDIVWASVVNQTRLLIRDSYSRDKSTPLMDEDFPEGKNSLTAAYGMETNERTIVMFRRAVTTNDPADHPLGPGQIFGIYAKGQDDGETRWVVKEALAQPQNKDRAFVHRDELMYHGSDYRAMAMFRFTDK